MRTRGEKVFMIELVLAGVYLESDREEMEGRSLKGRVCVCYIVGRV